MRALLAAFLVALAAPAALAGEHGGFDGLPDSAMFGICNAYEHNENGREHGNAGNAPPFRWLADQAEGEDETVAEFCERFPHPGQGDGNEGGA